MLLFILFFRQRRAKFDRKRYANQASAKDHFGCKLGGPHLNIIQKPKFRTHSEAQTRKLCKTRNPDPKPLNLHA